MVSKKLTGQIFFDQKIKLFAFSYRSIYTCKSRNIKENLFNEK